ncbi:MAG: prolipoprotein diacylglyceryl transferase [Actinomycetia bacterium]|nr:prolipoprotein diacylglyceryl transferase [Actinomycetes bacterium]
MTGLLPLVIPSPSESVWYLGPVPVRAYALAILSGIIIGWWLTARRWKALGGDGEVLEGILMWAVLLGILGARAYHVVTDSHLYFGQDAPWPWYHIFYVWQGGLGIWGAVAVGAAAAWWRSRKAGVSFAAVADCIAPGLLLAQGVGRLGNWFNQELYGRPTELPWALAIDPWHRIPGYEQYATYHPTFLYELLWTFLVAGALLLLERRFALGRGKLFALYIVGYTLGRFFIEALRIDTVTQIGGFRLNNYTSAVVFVAGLLLFVWLLRHRPGPNPRLTPEPAGPEAGEADSEEPSAAQPSESPPTTDPGARGAERGTGTR